MFQGIAETSIVGLHKKCVSTLIKERNKNCHSNFLFWILVLFFFIQQLFREILPFFKRLKIVSWMKGLKLCSNVKFSEPLARKLLLGPREEGTTVTTSNTETAQLLWTFLDPYWPRKLITSPVTKTEGHAFSFGILLCPTWELPELSLLCIWGGEEDRSLAGGWE